MKIKLDSFIYHLVFLLTLVSLFFLNNDRTSSNEIILNIVLSFFTFIFLILLVTLFFYRLYVVGRKVIVYMFFCVCCCCCVYLARNYVIVHWIYLFISFYIAFASINLNKKVLKISVYLSFCSVVLQLVYFRFSGRPVLSYIDPNYSGYYIFCLFLYTWFNNYKKIALCLILCGLLTLSRNFILAIFVFFLVANSSCIRKMVLRFNYTSLLLLGYVVLFIISTLYIAKFSEEVIQSTTNGEKDISQIVDRSNLDRFTANILFIDDFTGNIEKYFWGIDTETYTKNVFRNGPHNSLLQLVLNYGLFFSFFYFLLLSVIFSRYHKSLKFVSAYSSLIVYFLLLGGGIYGIQVIWLSFIYKSSIDSSNFTYISHTTKEF